MWLGRSAVEVEVVAEGVDVRLVVAGFGRREDVFRAVAFGVFTVVVVAARAVLARQERRAVVGVSAFALLFQCGAHLVGQFVESSGLSPTTRTTASRPCPSFEPS